MIGGEARPVQDRILPFSLCTVIEDVVLLDLRSHRDHEGRHHRNESPLSHHIRVFALMVLRKLVVGCPQLAAAGLWIQ